MNRPIIYYDLNKSPYVYNYKNYDFIFSSLYYLSKYNENVELFIKNERIKLEKKYNITINDDIFFRIIFYKKIEKRGFLIKNNDQKINTQEYLLTVKLND